MAEVLILTVDGGGNVPPALALADELQRRGHRVSFLGHPRQEAEIRPRGHGFAPYRHAPLWSGHEHRSSARAAVDFLLLVTDRRCRRDLASQLRRQPADVVVVDAMIPEAGPAAGELGVPYAYLMHTFAQFFLDMSRFEWLARLRGGSMRRAWAAAPLSIVASDRRLDPAPADVPSSFVWTGVVEQPPAAPKHPRTPPQVLVSLSSVAIPGQDRLLQRILDALAPLRVSVVATTGPTIAPTSVRPPSNAAVHAFLPHHEIMPSSSLVIGHGGHSTTMRALMHDLPVLVLPADPRIDQPMIGRAVQAAGAGLTLPKTATIDRIRAAVVRLLDDGSYRQAAAETGARLRAQNGTAAAASLVLGLAGA